jgi:hypothetical protein
MREGIPYNNTHGGMDNQWHIAVSVGTKWKRESLILQKLTKRMGGNSIARHMG